MKKKYLAIGVIALLFFILGWQTKVYFSAIPIVKESIKKPIETHKVTLLEKIKAKKQLDVIILNSLTVYYVGADRKLGFEYELVESFANFIDVDLNLSVVYNINEALQMSKSNIGDITVAGLSITKERQKEFNFGPRYYRVQEQFICNSRMHRNGTFPKDFIDLAGLNIVIGKDTSYETSLYAELQEHEGIELNITTAYSTEQLLEFAHKGKIDCTVADSNIFMINQRYYPNLSRAFVLGEPKSLAWILRKGDNSLNKALYEWFNIYEDSGKFAELKDFYYSFLNLFDYYDNKIFTQRLKKRLPKYKKYFQEAGKKYNIPWELLAAQSYQESHWNPKAKSYTGVRGMMMLTRVTAKQLGVKNRLNAKESIFGGAKYIAKLEKRFDKKIEGKSRWAFALAAYNIGMGHIHDAQNLARKLNKNPYSWKDVKAILPLLSTKKYYKKLKYGYARGQEPVNYVNAIVNYTNIMIQSK